MLFILCCVALVVLALSSLTKHRILVMCGFYLFYALLTVMDEGNVPHLGPVTVYRALYVIILISLVARFIQDRSFLIRVRSWPILPYFILIIVLLASSLYSISNAALAFDESGGLWSRTVVILLFMVAGCHIHRESDLRSLAVTAVAVSQVLSVWVIWNAAQLNFEAYRGGIKTDMNYVSIFIFLGTLALGDAILVGKARLATFLLLPLLLCQLFAALILASRGGFAAFALASAWIVVSSLRGRGRWKWLGVSAAFVVVVGITLVLPGSGNFIERFSEGDLRTLDERTLIWSQSWKYFADSGFARMLFGQGLSSASIVIGPVIPDLANYHSEYLRWLMDTGIVGLSALLLFLYAVGRLVVQSDHALKNLTMGWFVFLLVAGLTGATSDLHAFWILLGAMVSGSTLKDNGGHPPPPVLKSSPRTPSPIAPVTNAVELH